MSSAGAHVLCETLDASDSVKTVDFTATDVTSTYVKTKNLLDVETINGAAYHAYGGDETYKSISSPTNTATIVEADGIAWKFVVPAETMMGNQTLTINLPTNLVTTSYFPLVQVLGTSAPSASEPVGSTESSWVGSVLKIKRDGGYGSSKLVGADVYVKLVKYV